MQTVSEPAKVSIVVLSSMIHRMRPSDRRALTICAESDPDRLMVGMEAFIDRWAKSDWIEEPRIEHCGRWMAKLCSPDLVARMARCLDEKTIRSHSPIAPAMTQTCRIFLRGLKAVEMDHRAATGMTGAEAPPPTDSAHAPVPTCDMCGGENVATRAHPPGAKTPEETLYHEDFHEWAIDQTERLRHAQSSGLVIAPGLDIQHLIEEMTGLGERARLAVVEPWHRIMERLHTLQVMTDPDAINAMRKEVLAMASQARRAYRCSMREHIDMDDIWASARADTRRTMKEWGLPSPPGKASCPLTLDQLIIEPFDLDAALDAVADGLHFD